MERVFAIPLLCQLICLVCIRSYAAADPLSSVSPPPEAVPPLDPMFDTPNKLQQHVVIQNAGITSGPSAGTIIGPFKSLRSTTAPWPLRHMMGEQLTGAPEPLVYSPVFKFVPDADPPTPKWQDVFSNPTSYSVQFGEPNKGYEFRGQNDAPALNPLLSSALLQSIAPSPPPFVNVEPPSRDGGPATGPSAATPPPTALASTSNSASASAAASPAKEAFLLAELQSSAVQQHHALAHAVSHLQHQTHVSVTHGPPQSRTISAPDHRDTSTASSLMNYDRYRRGGHRYRTRTQVLRRALRAPL